MEEEKQLIIINTEEISNQLHELFPIAHKELNDEDTELKVVRFLFNGEAVYIERNQDYLFRPSESWKLVAIVNKALINQVYRDNNVDIFIKSKILQWAATCISKTFCTISFYKVKEFDEDQFVEMLKDIHKT